MIDIGFELVSSCVGPGLVSTSPASIISRMMVMVLRIVYVFD